MNKTLSLVVVCLFISTLLMAQTRPNIIVIFTDDHGWADLGVNGVVEDIKTPNLDQLAADGVRFTNGYVTGPQCIPSRAGILSGRYQQSFGVDDNRYSPMPIEINTVPERLQTAGYRTGQVGKWHLDPNVDSEEWLRNNTYKGQTLPPRPSRVIPFQAKLPYYPGNQGFDEYFCGSISNYWANYDLNGNDLNPNGETQVISGRDRLDIQSDAALAFINRNFDNPFFLYLAYFAPHVPLASSEKYLSRFPGEMPERRRYALAMISAVDEGVGRIREQLQEHGILDNTLIFFIGDNGAPLAIHMEDRPLNENGWDGSLNTPLRGEKGMLSEGGIRIPYLMSWPAQVDAGQVLDIPLSSLDVGATAVAVSGLERDADLKG
jgi:arylsulfatase A-like enzyme